MKEYCSTAYRILCPLNFLGDMLFFRMKTVAIVFTTILGLLSSFPTVSKAGPFQDKLLHCIGTHLTKADGENFAGFIALSMANLPEMEGIVFINPQKSSNLIAAYVSTLERLFLSDCLNESKQVSKFEGITELIGSTKIVGQMAMRQRLSDPTLSKIFDEMEGMMSKDRWDEVMR